MILLTDYCLFTIEHSEARRVFIRGVADITEPIDDFDKIVWFREGNDLQHSLPSNPFNENEEDFELFNQLLECVKANFEDICQELVFAQTVEKADKIFDNHYKSENFIVEFEKVII